MAGSMKKLKASLRPRLDNATVRELTLKPFAGLPYSLGPLSVEHLFPEDFRYPTLEELEEEERRESGY